MKASARHRAPEPFQPHGLFLRTLTFVAVVFAVAACGRSGGHPLALEQHSATPADTARHAAHRAGTHPPSSQQPATPRTSRTGKTKMLLGVFEYGAEVAYRRVEKFAATVGRQPDIVVSFGVWGAPFDTRFASIAHAHGTTVLIQVEPTNASLASIIAGKQDKYLRSYAAEIQRFGHRVILSFAPEPNGPWYPWGWTRSSPASWRAAWRHVVTLFRKRKANNVTWLWTVDRKFTGSGPLPAYWPGAAYVDWVGIDAYYVHRGDTFDKIFGPTLAEVRRFTTRPVLISETAAGQIAGRARAIPDLFAGSVRADMLGLVWFDMNQHRNIYHQNWRLEGHPAAIAAFRRALASWKPRN